MGGGHMTPTTTTSSSSSRLLCPQKQHQRKATQQGLDGNEAPDVIKAAADTDEDDDDDDGLLSGENLDENKMRQLSKKLGLPMGFRTGSEQNAATYLDALTKTAPPERQARQYLNRRGQDEMLPVERAGEQTKRYKIQKKYRPTPLIKGAKNFDLKLKKIKGS
eukprot:jgi/Bigna1/86204/estExt_fgenesh1_pg.C_80312